MRCFGADQAVTAVVLVAGDDLAGLAALFFDQVAGLAWTKLSDSGLYGESVRFHAFDYADTNSIYSG
ncbi:hypothetical protein A1342_15380 [Methylomonas methanica]|uniref:Uncharacterized protein n=1 Tax=Methylomonas denitrificans TaxID=1538553 RepID=A0A126T5F6_9GAMM|nr:hypothetical protein JT25_012580 [Methylomonas denitrificans]OAH97802.1 hypothetical protein A1342_15380 [Methylomonas methanica]